MLKTGKEIIGLFAPKRKRNDVKILYLLKPYNLKKEIEKNLLIGACF